jgi:hypothetical protein
VRHGRRAGEHVHRPRVWRQLYVPAAHVVKVTTN